LPIAEMPVSVLLILGLGAAVGFISGLFGIGGGFLMTPLLIFLGIPPAVAVATQSAQIVASSTTSVLGALRRNAPMALVVDEATICADWLATATAGGMPRKIKSGVMRKPPPMPNRPEMKPTAAPSPRISNTLTGISAMGK